MARMVVALGGNALGETPEEQQAAVKSTAEKIVQLIKKGHEIVLAHGNGPQVGMINLAFESSSRTEEDVASMPFPECGAMSQGYIGYHLQNAIQQKLREENIDTNVASLITQVIVDEDDPAFDSPTKPIGAFYSREEADRLEKEKGYSMVEDSGRGYRRVVPSPLPVDIAEKDMIRELVASGKIVIACGGGGIPVVRKENGLAGVPAVIDKDHASEKLAEELEADYLIILTEVEKVALNFGTEEEKWLDEMTTEEAKRYADEGHFAEGSMLPKVKAAVEFAESGPNKKSLITSLENADAALKGKTGTQIYEAREGEI
ncbi:carbamate kinase [Halarsenatibacter silvermanii]|uniref:Carbamate kinase n=1 Tax=Halarsenatibacter silvermanii TaxID=321763 RepID=A0A1G9MBE3_9FIRM|nr:carbamate kinase [Halarsenatibacter silvermanii]SDL71433.1 carbamate kinase [Halarsenatibacter silvermanii]